jgi:hypothetical protein
MAAKTHHHVSTITEKGKLFAVKTLTWFNYYSHRCKDWWRIRKSL